MSNQDILLRVYRLDCKTENYHLVEIYLSSPLSDCTCMSSWDHHNTLADCLLHTHLLQQLAERATLLPKIQYVIESTWDTIRQMLYKVDGHFPAHFITSIYSLGYHLDECWLVALMLVAFLNLFSAGEIRDFRICLIKNLVVLQMLTGKCY